MKVRRISTRGGLAAGVSTLGLAAAWLMTGTTPPAAAEPVAERTAEPAATPDVVAEEGVIEVEPEPAAPAAEDAAFDAAALAALAARDDGDDGIAAVMAEAGQVLPTTPRIAPGAPADDDVTIEQIRGHLLAGDTSRALHAAESFAASKKWGRDRDAAWLLIGLIHREEGRHNSASDAFTKVRSSEGPLAPFGAWYEAEQDLARGKASTAVKECTDYRTKWPDGPHAGDCLRVIARGWALQGKETLSRNAAKEYDELHPKAPISEQVELALAMWEAENAPEKSVTRLKQLAIQHRAALTGRTAEQLLAKLGEAGVEGAALPDDTASLQVRAVSLRESGRRDDAWAVWEELVRRSEDDPKLLAWVNQNATQFGWRTHHWDWLADLYAKRYEAQPDAGTAYEVHKVLGRAGRWKEAAEWARIGQTKHGGTREWRGQQEEVGKTFLLAGDYADARDTFDAMAARGGWTGRRAEFYAAFAVYMKGDLDDAVTRFGKIVERKRDYDVESRYWRAEAYEKLGKADLARADRESILAAEPLGWYGLLVAPKLDAEHPKEAPFARAGTWPGPDLPPLPEVPQLALGDSPADVPVAAWAAPRMLEANAGFASLTWGMDPAPEPVASAYEIVQRDLMAPPPSYTPGAVYDPVESRKRFGALAAEHGDEWPVLPAIHDLAGIGLYDLSGALFADWYEDWRDALRSGRNPHHLAAREASMPQDEWRSLFLFTRDHHHTARFLYGLDRSIEDPATKLEALRLAWPLAHDRYVWTHARENDVDPYMVLGLMRQESTYSAIAMSPVGARGAMQIMPKTGHLLADIERNTSYTSGDLEDPVFAVGYGITYMGRLMDRFDGVFPLAVASYNGGPHNVGSWLQGTGLDVPTDAFVEMIPFRETRHYVKVVSANYASYLALYAPEGTRVTVPPKPLANDKTVVDF